MVYAANAQHYRQAGWPCILPVPTQAKFPPPEGYTGDHGIDDIPLEVFMGWIETHANCSIALRMPAGVIAIDIDTYDKTSTLPDGTTKTVSKHGDDTIREYEERWEPLPPTWASTARGTDKTPGPSRTLFYRVPPGRYRSRLGDAVEILQRHHRYAVVWPSANPDAGGACYRWYEPSGQLSEDVPHVDQLPELPPTWVNGLAEGASSPTLTASPADQGQSVLAEVLADNRPPCAEIENALQQARGEFSAAAAGSRHDAATRRVYQIIRLAAYGHTGAGRALGELADHWAALTAGEGRESEWDRMCLSAACKAVTEVGAAVPLHRDPCAMVSHWIDDASRRRQVAEHEAAHSIVAQSLGVPVRLAHVLPDGSGECRHESGTPFQTATIALAGEIWIGTFRSVEFPADLSGAYPIGGPRSKRYPTTSSSAKPVIDASLS